jgi:hypothetical protein
MTFLLRALCLTLAFAALAYPASLTVHDFQDIYRAGGNPVTYPDRGTPPSLFVFSSGPGKALTFSSVVGVASAGCGVFGPDGNLGGIVGGTTTGGTLADILYPGACSLPLMGVFLGPGLPASMPSLLDFRPSALGIDFAELSPADGQVFWIGDGLTGTGSGDPQTFDVPADATRLYLGFVDCCFHDNPGLAMTATFDISGGEATVPEPATLILTGSMLAVLRRRFRVRSLPQR